MLGIKQTIYLGVGVVAIGALTALGWKLYQAGKDAERVKAYKAAQEQRDEHDAKLKVEVKKALDDQAKNFVVIRNRAIEKARAEAEAKQEIITIIEKAPDAIKEDEETGCPGFSLESIRLLNDSKDRANANTIRGQINKAEGRPEPISGMFGPDQDKRFSF